MGRSLAPEALFQMSETGTDTIASNVLSGFEFSETEPDNLSLLAIVSVPVSDIWNKASGARPAHAARILVEEVGLPRSERFDVAESGNPNRDVLSRVDDL